MPAVRHRRHVCRRAPDYGLRRRHPTRDRCRHSRGLAQGRGRGRAPLSRISLVLSDVDGTLVTTEKQLTDATILAVRRLAEHNIQFTVTSSRPPFGLRMLVERLALQLPLGAFNGACLAAPDLSLISQHCLSPNAAARAIEVLESFDVGIWLFSAQHWWLRDRDGDYVERERRTVATNPTVIPDYASYLVNLSKIVGVSRDFDRLAECEMAVKQAIGPNASAAPSRSWPAVKRPLNVAPARADS